MSAPSHAELVYMAICRGVRTVDAIEEEVNGACRYSPKVPRTDVRGELKRLLTLGAIVEVAAGAYALATNEPLPPPSPARKRGKSSQLTMF